MEKHVSDQHPLRRYFGEVVHRAFAKRLEIRGEEEVERYLTDMLLRFLHEDALYAIRDLDGRPVRTVAEMLLEGDVRFNADSFDREREVHRHIGDYLLFWTGVYPEHLERLWSGGGDALLDAERQARVSYAIVSEFRHRPYDREAPLYAKLSGRFERYVMGLRVARHELGLAA
ncbi:MAG: hypothetical protein KIS66_15145 [Fimbriimonadaceae bacterium]|nr:hypothetical protein [Fimbriimonadaceae bacterium]